MWFNWHTRRQCTKSMDSIEVSLFRQRLRIQRLHQVQFRYDALEPLFTNDLRAYFNPRRGWTSQLRFGPIYPLNHNPLPQQPPNPPEPHNTHYVSSSTSHATQHTPNPGLDTPLSTLPTLYNTTLPHHHATTHFDTEHATLNSTTNSLHLGNQNVPPPPLNSLVSPSGHDFNFGTFTMRPPWDPSRDSGLRWTWLDNFGPFITNGGGKGFPDSVFGY